jgi:hypothetical protein
MFDNIRQQIQLPAGPLPQINLNYCLHRFLMSINQLPAELIKPAAAAAAAAIHSFGRHAWLGAIKSCHIVQVRWVLVELKQFHSNPNNT